MDNKKLALVLSKAFIAGSIFGSKMCKNAILTTDPIRVEDLQKEAETEIKKLLHDPEIMEESKWQQKRENLKNQ